MSDHEATAEVRGKIEGLERAIKLVQQHCENAVKEYDVHNCDRCDPQVGAIAAEIAKLKQGKEPSNTDGANQNRAETMDRKQ